MQLHADLTGLPVEVVSQGEPGAFGAALMAGVGCGAYSDLTTAIDRLVVVSRRFEPDPERGRRFDPIRTRLATAGMGR
jgi:sugar (pentulose or hexulose) kinase